ncbi:MAG: ytrB 2 [Verrucomicrobia bacterium]|nr:ytrB 2 [Verrucomicrobiota bacterium]
MNDSSVIQLRGLTKYFGKSPAVYELNLDVPRGCVFAFLGRNGSGKTTTIRMMLGLVPPTRGGGTVLGGDIHALTPEIRGRIGYLTEEHQLYPWMTVKECGEFQSAFYPRWNDKVFRGVVGHFKVKPEAKVKDLSRGERGGLCLALTLAPDPELLILDDPALGLDPVARRSLVESMIYLTRRADRTIFFSSHDLADVERVADHIAVMDRSVLRACCPIDTFRTKVQHLRLSFPGEPPKLPQIPGLLQVYRSANELRLVCVERNGATRQAVNSLSPARVEMLPISLEDAFLSYLGEHGEKTFILAETEEKP